MRQLFGDDSNMGNVSEPEPSPKTRTTSISFNNNNINVTPPSSSYNFSNAGNKVAMEPTEVRTT